MANEGEIFRMKYKELLQKSMEQIVCDKKRQVYKYEEMLSMLCEEFTVAKQKRNTLYFIGNGGSAGIAVHMTADFLKNGRNKTHGMFDVSTITCLGNDFGYEYIFSEQIKMVAEKNDILVAISSSGNSLNIIQAVQEARKKECRVITFSGFKEENKLRQLGDYNVYVPSLEYGIVESIHNMILQHIVDEISAKS